MANIQRLDPIVKPTRLPGGDVIDMDRIDGFTDLDATQKHFLLKYIELFPRKLAAAQEAHVSNSVLNSWMSNDSFTSVMNTIKEYYAESLSSIHLNEAFEDPRVRTQVLKALNAEGYESKEKQTVRTQNNLVLNANGGIAGMLEQLKANSAE